MPHNERLQKWADALRLVPDEHFNISFFSVGIERMPKSIEEIHKCGTEACAAGYLPVIFPDDWEWSEKNEVPKLKDECSTGIISHVARYFGLNNVQADSIMFRSEYSQELKLITPNIVADRIESFID